MGFLNPFRKGRRSVDREYVSEFTSFMEQFMHDHPGAELDQRRGRAMYWDKRLDFQALEKEKQDTVPTDGYYYFALPGKSPGDRHY